MEGEGQGGRGKEEEESWKRAAGGLRPALGQTEFTVAH